MDTLRSMERHAFDTCRCQPDENEATGLAPLSKVACLERCDRSTMTRDDIDNGRMICQLGVAPLWPAEFVIFRFGQKTADIG